MLVEPTALPSPQALALLHKYCVNIQRDPANPKFRRIRVLNKKFHKVDSRIPRFQSGLSPRRHSGPGLSERGRSRRASVVLCGKGMACVLWGLGVVTCSSLSPVPAHSVYSSGASGGVDSFVGRPLVRSAACRFLGSPNAGAEHQNHLEPELSLVCCTIC